MSGEACDERLQACELGKVCELTGISPRARRRHHRRRSVESLLRQLPALRESRHARGLQLAGARRAPVEPLRVLPTQSHDSEPFRHENLNPRKLPRAVQPAVDRHGNGAAAGVSEHDEEWRLQMAPGVLQAPCDFRRHHIPRDADDEQLAKTRFEDQLRRHARIAAAQDRRVGMLPPREVGEDFLLHGREARGAGDEAFVSGLEAVECLVGRERGFGVRAHVTHAPCGGREASSRAGDQFEGVALPRSHIEIQPVCREVVAFAVIDGVAEQIAESP